MKFLLDSSTWIRSASEPQTIPSEVKKLLLPSSEDLGLSMISIWEVAKKNQIGKLPLSRPLSDWLTDALAAHVRVLPLTSEIIVDAMQLPEFPNHDPADELIVATARAYDLTLITTDRILKNYSHARIHYFKPQGN